MYPGRRESLDVLNAIAAIANAVFDAHRRPAAPCPVDTAAVEAPISVGRSVTSAIETGVSTRNPMG
jgi:hypothetical protein